MARSRIPTGGLAASGESPSAAKPAKPAAHMPRAANRPEGHETPYSSASAQAVAPLSAPAVPPPPVSPAPSPSSPPPLDSALAERAKWPALEGSAFAAAPSAAPKYLVDITLIQGGLTKVNAPIAIGARYEGLGFAGGTKAFDRLLDSWLTRVVELGMIGSGLGQLFPVHLQRMHDAGKVQVGCLLLVGMGEPGRFAADDLRFMMSNVTVAVKSMGHDQFATSLFGTHRKELPIEDAVRGFMMGIVDGYDRFRAIAGTAQERQERLLQAAASPLSVLLLEPEGEKLRQIQAALEMLSNEKLIDGLKLTILPGEKVDPDLESDSNPADTEPDVPVSFLRVIRKDDPAPATSAAFDGVKALSATESFEFSALSETAAVAVRDREISAYLLKAIPDRMMADLSATKRERLGRFFADIVIPEAFRATTESAVNLTLEVDETTATLPWEMMAQKKNFKTTFLGNRVGVSRQFRSMISPRPSSPPPLNTKLSVLVIADPAPFPLALPYAREEGFSIIEVLDQARRAWLGQYEIEVTVRIGSCTDRDKTLEARLEELRCRGDWIVSADWCDALDIAILVVSEQYDVIHYAGHGFVDQKTGRAGWVLDKDCYLSAQEIFRVRQVPRLVFANACFSSFASDGSRSNVQQDQQQKHLVGVARAFFARGIPNFIGTGWQVDDECARECARWFYARALGLSRPDSDGEIIGTSPPATISAALLEARNFMFRKRPEASTWGAYQHYGRVSDKLLPLPNVQSNSVTGVGATLDESSSHKPASDAASNPTPPTSGAIQMPTPSTNASVVPAALDLNLVYVNGIDFETGEYAVAPRSIEELAKDVRQNPGADSMRSLHGNQPRSYALPFDVAFDQLEETGWGIIFHENTPRDVHTALGRLLTLRGNQAKGRFKELDYRSGEQARDWYARHGIGVGSMEPGSVPYYLLLVGGPELIPFEFQYLLGVEYAVGRLAFDTAAEYERYARSIDAYEGGNSVPNAKEIVYWGTHHLGDGATELSSSQLISPLANGIPGTSGAFKQPLGAQVHYGQKLLAEDDATKAALLEGLHAAKPPALLFTASHGMAIPSGRPNQKAVQGALLCQDWPSFGSVRPEHILCASDVGDDANVNGMIALVFACFGGGTPDVDQFLMNLSPASKAPPLAPQPFVAALPRRLLSHPNGSALAVIGHIDRAWGFSIQAPNTAGPQIGPFRNGLGGILTGNPVGHAVNQQFGSKFAALSATLLNGISPTAPASMRLSDRDLVTAWLQRNDAQNYVLLGDPAARIRNDLLA
jgi:CHAT domain